eukprot:3745064-Pleurochrysis_carterae.AAC.1
MDACGLRPIVTSTCRCISAFESARSSATDCCRSALCGRPGARVFSQRMCSGCIRRLRSMRARTAATVPMEVCMRSSCSSSSPSPVS